MNKAEEMRIKEDAPLFSRSTSPERKYVLTLEDIPEATPGPNAFAQQAARMDRHRLDGNAFYQQEVQKRRATPPTMIHPALRPRINSDPPTPPRESSCTTMSPFINAGKEPKPDHLPLKLLPSDSDLAVPTLRGLIEERAEQARHEARGANESRIPVFNPTRKIASVEFASPGSTPKRRGEKTSVNQDPPSKTPKKGFFGRLKLSTNSRGPSVPSTNSIDDFGKTEGDEKVPVKAQAVLGASPSKSRKSFGSSPSKSSIPRSPSKRTGFFSRKNSGLAEISESTPSLLHNATVDGEQKPLSASSITKTPQTAISDPTHYSCYGKRVMSQTQSDQGGEKGVTQCAVTRSQSLKYFDHSVPPTPPAKNTPPDEKTRREAAAANKSSRLPFHDEQSALSKEPAGIVSTSGRISPTRFGSYGHKDMPTLVTKPSVYSLHASVVPDMTEANTFEEMKARIDGLGLEGFNTPLENNRASTSGVIYSPSNYSSEWAVVRPNIVTINPPTGQTVNSPNCQSTHTKESSSSGGDIQVCYPELSKDPSITSMDTLRAGTGMERHQKEDSHLGANLPWHGCTHSLDHSINSPRPSVESSIFAHHVENGSAERLFDSPTSFSHQSAAPSPLHLPSTVFTPPPLKTSKLPISKKTEEKVEEMKHIARKGLGIHSRSRSATPSPSKRSDIFQNAPLFPARNTYDPNHTPSPYDSGIEASLGAKHDVDPQKSSPAKSPSSDKLDRMIDILNRLNLRNEDINSMRDELRATNERLDQRLAAVENLHRASPAPSYTLDETLRNEKVDDDGNCTRVPTAAAHDFYRGGEGVANSVSDLASASDFEQSDSDTIAELKETNRRLLEMVGGFAEKIQLLEKRAGGNV